MNYVLQIAVLLGWAGCRGDEGWGLVALSSFFTEATTAKLVEVRVLNSKRAKNETGPCKACMSTSFLSVGKNSIDVL